MELIKKMKVHVRQRICELRQIDDIKKEEKDRNRPTHSSLAPLMATPMAQYLVLPLGALKVC